MAQPARQDGERPLTSAEERGLDDFQKSQRWFLDHEKEMLRTHAGKFIAIQSGVLIAASTSLDELLRGVPPDCDRSSLFIRRVPASSEETDDVIPWI